MTPGFTLLIYPRACATFSSIQFFTFMKGKSKIYYYLWKLFKEREGRERGLVHVNAHRSYVAREWIEHREIICINNYATCRCKCWSNRLIRLAISLFSIPFYFRPSWRIVLTNARIAQVPDKMQLCRHFRVLICLLKKLKEEIWLKLQSVLSILSSSSLF